MDAIDRNFLAELQQDGRLTVTELAERVRLSVSPCHRRLRALERSGAVSGYRAFFDAKTLGLRFEALVFVTMRAADRGTVAAFEDAITAIPNVLQAQRSLRRLRSAVWALRWGPRHLNERLGVTSRLNAGTIGAVSPQSRGRPPSRGRRPQPARRPAPGRGGPRGVARPSGNQPVLRAGQATDCWFDEPLPGDRRSWAVPSGHGTYQGLSLELLNPADEDERTFLVEAQHPGFEDALRNDQEMTVGGEPFSPRLHIVLHQIVASQLLAGNPPETWQTVQRLAGLGYDWHNVMHMIAVVVSGDLYQAMNEHRPFDPGDHARRLNELPGDWPPLQALGPQ